MKKVGIVGGVSWPSTVAYYTGICRRAEKAHAAAQLDGLPAMPEFVIESLDHRRAVMALGRDPDEDSWRGFDAYHADALGRLERSKADFALIASNTAHHRFASIAHGIGIPLLNLFDELAATAAKEACEDVLVLGTALTMGSAPLRAAFMRHGIRAAGPSDPSVRQATIQLINEIHGGSSGGFPNRLEQIVAKEVGARGGSTPVVCLACTELPLIFARAEDTSAFERSGFTYIDSTWVHINAAFEAATGKRGLGNLED